MQDTAGTLQVELKPCLAELLRTCIHPPTLLLRVEHVFGKAPAGSHGNAAVGLVANLPHDGGHPHEHLEDRDRESHRPWSLRLALSDSILQIQAVLAKRLHSKELLGLQRGDLVEIGDFQLRRATRRSGHGEVVYLGIQQCAWVGRDHISAPQLEFEGGFVRDEDEDGDDEMARKRQKTDRKGRSLSKRSPSDLSTLGKRGFSAENDDQCVSKRLLSGDRTASSHSNYNQTVHSDDSEDDYFETIVVSQKQADERREMLRQINQPDPAQDPNGAEVEAVSAADTDGLSTAASPLSEASRNNNLNTHPTDRLNDLDPIGSQSRPDQNDNEPSAIKHSRPPSSLIPAGAPLHTLASLLDPTSSLPPRNYACTIFGMITWVSTSLIHRLNTPYPPKRHVKVHDPSILHRQAGITLAVFIDAQNFAPKVGTVALLRGVVMQRYQDDVILNKYGSFGNKSNEDHDDVDNQDWFVNDEKTLLDAGFDVEGMKQSWLTRIKKKG
ncbi:hypothetical protein A1O1_03547 [Capronia coronata CBS 617.96]|uniref:Uncharacterized protein n=1 Tax=Capronia coronata CBS 617.96 TaxID=1182541 RepID=W9YLA6_9EURO|nr:uncharacterized protein A1O1_03547 [Capronia coronata CBS 617.96]EXJ90445.1 hypothetical protein A1O1_03547 [Capronia coronata CBS 617.96]